MIRIVGSVLAVLLLAGCGGGAKSARRGDVNHYVANVNDVEHGTLTSWNELRNTYSGLARGKISTTQLRRFAKVPTTIRVLRARVAGMPPPADARRLRALLLRLLDLDAAFADEVSTFARYVRAVRPLQARVGRDTLDLRQALRRAHSTRAQQQVLDRFAARLTALRVQLLRLRPPAALAPWHGEQAGRVQALRHGARELARGLERHDRESMRRGLAELTNAASGAPVTVADRAAILAFDGRLARLRIAAAAVSREEARLTRRLT